MNASKDNQCKHETGESLMAEDSSSHLSFSDGLEVKIRLLLMIGEGKEGGGGFASDACLSTCKVRSTVHVCTCRSA